MLLVCVCVLVWLKLEKNNSVWMRCSSVWPKLYSCFFFFFFCFFFFFFYFSLLVERRPEQQQKIECVKGEVAAANEHTFCTNSNSIKSFSPSLSPQKTRAFFHFHQLSLSVSLTQSIESDRSSSKERRRVEVLRRLLAAGRQQTQFNFAAAAAAAYNLLASACSLHRRPSKCGEKLVSVVVVVAC